MQIKMTKTQTLTKAIVMLWDDFSDQDQHGSSKTCRKKQKRVWEIRGGFGHKEKDNQKHCQSPARTTMCAVTQTALWPPQHREAQLLGIKWDFTSQLQSLAGLLHMSGCL